MHTQQGRGTLTLVEAGKGRVDAHIHRCLTREVEEKPQLLGTELRIAEPEGPAPTGERTSQPIDDQFGPKIPVGPPGAPEGELFVQLSIVNPDGPLEVGQTFVDQIDYDDDPTLADGKINFYAAYLGDDRLLPGDVTVEITELTDNEICVSLTSITETDLQTFVGFDGGVVFEREQSIDS